MSFNLFALSLMGIYDMFGLVIALNHLGELK